MRLAAPCANGIFRKIGMRTTSRGFTVGGLPGCSTWLRILLTIAQCIP
jgi:hypothetical protein